MHPQGGIRGSRIFRILYPDKGQEMRTWYLLVSIIYRKNQIRNLKKKRWGSEKEAGIEKTGKYKIYVYFSKNPE